MKKLKMKIPVILPQVPDEKDACINRIIDKLSGREGIDSVHISDEKPDGIPQLCFHYDPDAREFTAGRVEIQAGSIFTNLIARDNHLRGRDFLNTRRNPVIVFEATDYVSGNDAVPGTLAGNLTLLGQTHPVVLEVTINKQAKYPFGHRRETLGISAHTTITRSQWGMDYGVADNLVGDEVTLRFEFEAFRLL